MKRAIRVIMLLCYGAASSMWAWGASVTAAGGHAHWTVLPVIMLMFCGWMALYTYRQLSSS